MPFRRSPFQIALADDFCYDRDETLFTCTFYCLLGGAALPDDQWTDFAATVLDWWAEELLRASDRKQATFELLFEDGPFRLEGRRDGARVLLRGMTDRPGDVGPEAEVPFAELAKAVESAARRLSTALHQAGRARDAQAAANIAAKARRVAQRPAPSHDRRID